MSGFNKVIMMGNLTRDPEFKQLPSGQSICRLGLASNRQFKSRQSDSMVQEVCFVDIDVWGNQAESCNKYLEKGRSILIEGRLKLDTWQDNEGQKRSKHSIVAERVTFLKSGSVADDGMQAAQSSDFGQASASAAPKAKKSAKPAASESFDDDLPF